MPTSVRFHTSLYRRDALEAVVQDYRDRARVELRDAGDEIIAQIVSPENDGDIGDEFSNDVFAATARSLRQPPTAHRSNGETTQQEPPWPLLAPFGEGSELGLNWVIDSLSPIRSGSATLTLRHAEHGLARVAIRRNSGAPLGVAHTDHLDFMLMNGGGGMTQTEGTIGRVLVGLAREIKTYGGVDELLAGFRPHSEGRRPDGITNGNGTDSASRRIAPHVEGDSISFDLDETGVSRLAIYDAVLAFAERCHIHLTRPAANRIHVELKARGQVYPGELKVLVRDLSRALNQVMRQAVDGSPAGSGGENAGLPSLRREPVDLEALLVELERADANTLGVGFQPDRGPGHEGLRIVNILGKGACNSDCLFCCEKFNPSNRLMPSADATRQVILDSGGESDMLFFASGEPTIHPKLFEYVELAKRVGFTSFGMSSHFRTFADPRFALKTLQAGFEFFDISLHAADIAGQLDINPIEDQGDSLAEALKGLANIFRLASALGIRVSITHKIVISRLNVTELESIFHATYDRGVRHFILQPVRTLGLAPDRQQALAISEEEIIPYLNQLLEKTEGMGAVLKPYGFSRANLFKGQHIEHEQNRVKNVSGKSRRPRDLVGFPQSEERPSDGRPWVEVRGWSGDRFGFAAQPGSVILDEALQRGAAMPFGCRMGSCGMCCARLVEGTVDQSTQLFLTDEQIEQGFVLLCQARPLSDVTVRLCTDDEIDPL